MNKLILLAVLASCHSPSIYSTEENDIAQMRAVTTQVGLKCKNGGGTGTAVYVDTMYGGAILATAAHVIEDGCKATIGGQAVVLLASDKAKDIALVYLPGVKAVRMKFARGYLGQGIVAVGYPLQLYDKQPHLQVSQGHLLSQYGPRSKISAQVFFGSSGGPVFSKSGELVGIVTSIQLQGTVAVEFYITPSHEVAKMVRDTKAAWHKLSSK